MNDLVKDLWSKKLNEHLENQMAIFDSLNAIRRTEEALKMNEKILQVREKIKNTSVEELAEILVALEERIIDHEKTIEYQREKIQSLDKIRDIIQSEYGLTDYYDD